MRSRSWLFQAEIQALANASASAFVSIDRCYAADLRAVSVRNSWPSERCLAGKWGKQKYSGVSTVKPASSAQRRSTSFSERCTIGGNLPFQSGGATVRGSKILGQRSPRRARVSYSG